MMFKSDRKSSQFFPILYAFAFGNSLKNNYNKLIMRIHPIDHANILEQYKLTCNENISKNQFVVNKDKISQIYVKSGENVTI